VTGSEMVSLGAAEALANQGVLGSRRLSVGQ
jgi:hypothetical protein